MKFKEQQPPREFQVGKGERVTISDCGRVELNSDEQLTFVSDGDREYDVIRKSWGYYATPSMNGRLASFGLRGALIRGDDGKGFVFLVEAGKENDFRRYLEVERLWLVTWLDNDEALDALEALRKNEDE